jgi:hypothetical protein
MYRTLALLLMVILLVPVSAGPYFLEVYPDTWMKGDEDEYITIGWDVLPGPCTLSDGEGTITIQPGYSASRSCTIARNGERYKQVWGQYPSCEITDSTPAVPQVAVQGRFQLSNKKDDLTLSCQGIIYDTVTWPGTFQPRKGQIHIRSPEGRWDTRILMAGGTRLVPKTVENVTGTGFVSPDCSRQVLEETIRSAGRSILLNVYEFTDAGLSDLLCDTMKRGVKVSVLLEGGPVGGIPAEEFPIIQKLADAGAKIMVMEEPVKTMPRTGMIMPNISSQIACGCLLRPKTSRNTPSLLSGTQGTVDGEWSLIRWNWLHISQQCLMLILTARG